MAENSQLSLSERYNHWAQKTFTNQDPHNPKCCFVFPLKCGIIMIGLIAVSDLSQLSSTTARVVQIVPMATIPCIISMPLMFFAVCLFFRYFCLDNYDTRSRLVTASFLMIVANAITFFGLSIAILLKKDLNGNMFWGLIPTYVFPMVLWAYYREICK